MKKTFIWVEDRYKCGDDQIQKERGLSPNGNQLRGAWVLREKGKFVDFDMFRNDLAERNNIDLVE